jgi:sporulation protein YlmC with PRC-barrel domain
VTLFIGFDLLDRQVLDSEGLPVGNVDDVELAVAEDGTLTVAAILVGAQVWGKRLGGSLGDAVSGLASRLQRRTPAGPIRIPFPLVRETAAAITLSVSRDLLVEPELESWLREHLIARIPGSSADPEAGPS